MKKLDIVFTSALCLIFFPLSIWAGMNHWYGPAQYVGITMFIAAPIYPIIEGVRLKNAPIVAVLTALVTSCIFLPSQIILSYAVENALTRVFVFTILGFVVAFISAKKMTPSVKNRLAGILYLAVGIYLFWVARNIPKAPQLGLLTWALDLTSIYLVLFVSIKKIIKAKGSEVGFWPDEEKSWKLAFSIILVFLLAAVGNTMMFGIMKHDHKVTSFKMEAQNVTNKYRQEIVSVLTEMNSHYSESVPNEFYSLMQSMAGNEHFVYTFLYLLNPSDKKKSLWRYRGAERSLNGLKLQAVMQTCSPLRLRSSGFVRVCESAHIRINQR